MGRVLCGLSWFWAELSVIHRGYFSPSFLLKLVFVAFLYFDIKIWKSHLNIRDGSDYDT